MDLNIKNLRVFTVFIILCFSLSLFAAYSISAYDDCPYGVKDDPFPGICGRYIDRDNDGICDHSQSEPVVGELPDSQSSSESQSATIEGVPLQENQNLVKLVISFIIIIIVYILLHYAAKAKILSKAKERLIWNILLLIFFLPSVLTGIFLILMVSFPFLRDFGLLFLDLHNVTSYFFMWISAYHIIVHTRYYIKGIKSTFQSK
jgi:hypothetical protein